MKFETIDNYTQDAIIDLIGVGEYGKDVANYLERKGISGLDFKKSLSDIHDSDLIFVIALLDELSDEIEDTYSLAKKSTLSYLYVKVDHDFDYCNSHELSDLQKVFDVIIPIPIKTYIFANFYWSIKGITELISMPNLICADFAHIKEATKGMKTGLSGFGIASGIDYDNRAEKAALNAISSLRERFIDVKNIKGVMATVFYGYDRDFDDFTLGEFEDACNAINEYIAYDGIDKPEMVIAPVAAPLHSDNVCVVITVTGICN